MLGRTCQIARPVLYSLTYQVKQLLVRRCTTGTGHSKFAYTVFNHAVSSEEVIQRRISTCNKWLTRKEVKRGQRWQSTWCVQVLRSPKEAFAAAMQSWRERCEKCVCLQGDYVEK